MAGDRLYAAGASAFSAWRSYSLDIFEGTEQTQQLVMSRATSGLRIE